MLSKLRKAAENKGFILPFKQGVRGSNPRWSTKEKSLEMLEFQVFPGFLLLSGGAGERAKADTNGRKKTLFVVKTVVKKGVKFPGCLGPAGASDVGIDVASGGYVGMAQELLGVLVLGACLIEHCILRTTKEENKYFMRNILDKWRGLVVIYE